MATNSVFIFYRNAAVQVMLSIEQLNPFFDVGDADGFMSRIFCILILHSSFYSYTIILDDTNQLVPAFLKVYVDINFFFFSIHSMPDSVFNEWLYQQWRQNRFIRVKGFIRFHTK